ncbi:MAG: tetratricopeptide repeat protein [Bacteroidota bacterium]
MATCRSCHNNVHATFKNTGMGRSFHYATRQKSDAVFGKHALVYDSLNDFYYFPYFSENKNDSSMYVMEFRLENGDTTHKRIEKIEYIVGSGQHTNSHILDINGYVYQAPVTWYTQEEKWDMAPGFRKNNSRFGRWLTAECITCHNHFPKQINGSLNKFEDMPTGIECERCHGPGEAHVRNTLAGNLVDTSTNIDYSIVTPSDLSRDLQMDICQRCHLQGVAVTEPGKTFFDFRPGMKLNDIMNVFLPRYSDSHEKFIMASQADRMRLSECFKKDESLTCLTCHHPHHSIEVTPKEKYNNACKNCHGKKTNKDEKLNCSAPLAEREINNNNNCAGCHMPKSGSTDIPHVSITDHFITIPKQQSTTGDQQPKQFLGIKILTKDNPTPLDMARGYLATYDKYIESPIMLDSAFYYLNISQEKSTIKFPVLIHLLFAQNNFDKIIEELNGQNNKTKFDAWTAYRIGESFLRTGNFKNALNYFSEAVDRLPLHLDFLEKKGIALLALKRIKEAKVVFEKTLKENPKRPVALCHLGYAHVLTNNLPMAQKLYDQAIALDPDYAQALINKAALLALQNKNQDAKKLLEKVLKKQPENQQALAGLRRLIEN